MIERLPIYSTNFTSQLEHRTHFQFKQTRLTLRTRSDRMDADKH